MTARGIHETLLWIGSIGTIALLFVGLLVGLTGGPMPPSVLPAVLFFAVFALSPFWWTYRQQRKEWPSRTYSFVTVAVTCLLVLLPAYFYLTEFYILPTFYGIRPRTGSAFLVFIVPLLQWVAIAVGVGIRSWMTQNPDQHRGRE